MEWRTRLIVFLDHSYNIDRLIFSNV